MPADLQKHHRRSIRLDGYDYAQAGAYYVTVVTYQRGLIFGEIVEAEMRLNLWGQIAAQQWEKLPRRFQQIEWDEFVVMPNHVHGIVVITQPDRGAGGEFQAQNPPGSPLRPYVDGTPRVVSGSLGAIVRAYKSAVTYRIHALCGAASPPVWQRNYYERILRDENELNAARAYIQSNPLNWENDRERS